MAITRGLKMHERGAGGCSLAAWDGGNIQFKIMAIYTAAAISNRNKYAQHNLPNIKANSSNKHRLVF